MMAQEHGGSVVIPAHDEASVIGRCLTSIEAAVRERHLEVVVVCNGCADATAEVAASFPWARVLELEQPSKPAALRAGDRIVSAFPRIYLDADVVLPASSLVGVVDVLTHGPALAARPPVAYATEACSAVVRSYFRARTRIPVLMSALWGAGVYALSREGRARFGDFPDVVADDLFVDELFTRDQVVITDGAPVRVDPPRAAAPLLGVLRRTYRGKAEQQPSLSPRLRSRTSTVVVGLARSSLRLGPGAAADAALYTGLVLLARTQLRLTQAQEWERDVTTRQ